MITMPMLDLGQVFWKNLNPYCYVNLNLDQNQNQNQNQNQRDHLAILSKLSISWGPTPRYQSRSTGPMPRYQSKHRTDAKKSMQKKYQSKSCPTKPAAKPQKIYFDEKNYEIKQMNLSQINALKEI